ncbi:glycosyltransferase [Dyadobacter sp. OTU695]|uniref:glycosyltransferase n=1 Tax=Dyadobacter sp. OTU695 TaxID=3043860 RepID=UPI00313BB101
MMYLSSPTVSGLTWIRGDFAGTNKICILIPQYNEKNRTNFTERLDYFRNLALQHSDTIDVVLIDDGSTDDSLDEINSYINIWPDCFFVASVFPNGNKVGALHRVTISIPHEFIVLSDFDTDLTGLDSLVSQIDGWRDQPNQMGFYFRMIPYEGVGSIFQYQQLEYCLARMWYEYHRADATVPVMPGAGCCYKREILLSIYQDHSGLRNGEDREATMIGIRKGYSTVYLDSVLALTRPPLTYKDLVKQRIRWNLGYIETVFFERKAYLKEVLSFTRMGSRFLHDVLYVLVLLTLPLIVLFSSVFAPKLLLAVGAGYVGYSLWILFLLRALPAEAVELKKGMLGRALLFPAIKVFVESRAWFAAALKFITARGRSSRRISNGDRF